MGRRKTRGQAAYVVAVIERKDSLTEKTANALTPSKAFTILSLSLIHISEPTRPY